MTYLSSISIRNFKAIRNSGMVRLRPLTVFIGNNGSGKSSLIEAAHTCQRIVLDGLDAAFAETLGFDHVRHKAAPERLRVAALIDRSRQPNPMTFTVALRPPGFKKVRLAIDINSIAKGNEVFIQKENIRFDGETFERDGLGAAQTFGPGRSMLSAFPVLNPVLDSVRRWQFVLLDPAMMGQPRSKRRSSGRVALDFNGGNLAEYLLDIRARSTAAFDEIVESMKFVIPYGEDIQPTVADDLERRVFLELVEVSRSGRYKVPGWLLSTGTLRVLALLALLRDPDPPPVIFVEELENGLDPRTVGLIVDEIRTAVRSGRTQVIATTHSPYLLDLLTLDDLILVERGDDSTPKFFRPADDKSLQAWAEKFSPGRLYTMGQLKQVRGKPGKPSANPEVVDGGWE